MKKTTTDSTFIPFDDDKEESIQQKIDKALKEKYIPEENPWITPNTLKAGYAFVRLHNEIIDYVQYIQQSEEQKKVRKDLFRWVENVILSVFEDAKVKMFGSSATGLDLPSSDIDIVVFKEGVPIKTLIKSIENAFNSQEKRIKGMEVLLHTKVPLIKILESYSNINIDISFNTDDGCKAVPVLQDIIEKFPHFKYLVFVMKTFLKIRGLNETYTGGVGSFLLLLMVFAYLQYEYKERDYYISNLTLSEALLGFLEFYGSKFNHERLSISVAGEGCFLDKSLVEGAGEFSLLNPLDPTIDIGKSAHRIHKVFRAFEKAKENLMYVKDQHCSLLQKFFGSVMWNSDDK